MRTIYTFILRLLVDSADPEAFRGALQVASQNLEPQPFSSETALLGLLKCLVSLEGQPGSTNQDQEENNL
ncbi:MAG: hypothetical protein CVU39_01250 [Chloroflexi bacterium HGW-Chloroflexi-10]|nr:MAG: hypothetical protein CVU39_01250 [Chloroflexi bacterium HGW-Chloroflexi-10]